MLHTGYTPPVFTPDEYSARLASVRTRMQDQGLSALVVTDPANIYYLTGYNAWSFYTPQLLFVPADGDMLLFAREMDARGAHRTSWLPEHCIIGYPESYIHRPHLHPFDWVAYTLRRRNLVAAVAPGWVGLEMDSHFFSPKAHRALVHALPEWTMVDSFELVNWVRSVKSPAEIALMRKAARVTEAAMRAAEVAIAEGARQCDVAAAISAAQASGAEGVEGDYPAIVPMMPVGTAADTPHLTWTGDALRADEAVVVELAGVHRRYHVPMARTFVPGTPSPELQHLADATDQGLAAVLSTVGAGVPVQALANAWSQTMRAFGFEKNSRLGYSIGIAYPPDWGERTISIRDEETTILEENMTFHLICGMWMDGYGYEVSESIRVDGNGVELFTSYPRGILRTGSGRRPSRPRNRSRSPRGGRSAATDAAPGPAAPGPAAPPAAATDNAPLTPKEFA